MILIKNRELLIPDHERYIGTNYDASVENRVFELKRFTSGGTDLSGLTFYINLWFDGTPLDRAVMRKEINDDEIILIWNITEAQTSAVGTIFAAVTGNDSNGKVRWSSFQGAFYTEKSIGADIDTEYKKIVERLNSEISTRETEVDKEKAERIAGDYALSRRIDNIVASAGDDNTEIVDARLGADGKAHASLKGRLDSEYNALNTRVTGNEQQIESIGDEIAEARENIDTLFDIAVELDTGNLVDEYGKYLANSAGMHLSGQYYHVVTDESGTMEGVPADAGLVGQTFLMGISQMGLPIMQLFHPDIESLRSKADGSLSNVVIEFPYKGISRNLSKIKVQGASSQSYPKKNYTLTFDNNVVLNDAWGPHKKYVIKADWVDFSHMRNEIGAKLWGRVRATRINTARANLVDNNANAFVNASDAYLTGEIGPEFSMGMNYGAVDGYPICVFINGKYWGIYSLMIPKDDWMAGMTGANAQEAIVAAEDHTTSTQFREKVTAPNEDGEMYPLTGSKVAFSMEYVTDEDDMAWLSTSINRIIDAVNATYSTDQECIDALNQYIDIDSAIDYYIFSCLTNNIDGLDKNFLLDTFDGTRWFFVAYDMDGVFGSDWNGKTYLPADGGATFQYYANRSKLMNVIYQRGKTALKTRYEVLRNGVLSEYSVANDVWNYAVKIPKAAFDYEAIRWPTRPGTNTSNHEQMLRYYSMRCAALDAEIALL